MSEVGRYPNSSQPDSPTSPLSTRPPSDYFRDTVEDMAEDGPRDSLLESLKGKEAVTATPSWESLFERKSAEGEYTTSISTSVRQFPNALKLKGAENHVTWKEMVKD